MENLIAPYGGELPILLCDAYRAEALKREAMHFPSIDLDWQQLCELELILTGALAPLTGFMGKADLDSVLARMQLADGRFWARPVMLSFFGTLSMEPSFRKTRIVLSGSGCSSSSSR